MIEVVSVRFKSRGKLYFFDPAGIEVQNGDFVVVETSKGLEMGECSYGNHFVPDDKIIPPLRPVIRVATERDIRVSEENKAREAEAFDICKEKIAQHQLEMKLVDVEYNFEGSKILFFFTADGRVDFRELVKDLASVFRTRIELRQIGVRDEAKMLGGIGICGRQFCCGQFLDDFQPVSTKMAKTQSMSLNPTKISGTCGRLMCCLRYEQEAYEDLIKSAPKNGTYVETVAGYGNVCQVNLLRQKVKVRIDGDGDPNIKTYDVDDIAVIPGGRPAPGEKPPSLLAEKLRLRPAPEPEELEDSLPNRLIEQIDEFIAPGEVEPSPKKSRNNQRRRPQNKKPKSQNQEQKTADNQNAGGGKQSRRPQNKKPPAKAQNAPKAEGDKNTKAPKPRDNRRRRYGKPKPKAPSGDNKSE